MNWDEYFFRIVNVVALKSKDPSSKIGSVIVKGNRILSTGYNGFCMGVEDSPERYTNRNLKYQFIAHSEFNSCIVASRFGINLNNSILYTHSTPCNECAKSIIQSGVVCVKTLKSCNKIWETYQPNWTDSCVIATTMFMESGVTLDEYDILLNEKVLIGGKEYSI